MTRKSYKFNPETLTYEPILRPVRIRIYRVVRKVLIGFILACVVNFLFSFFFYTPKMSRIIRENRELEIKYSILHDRIRASARRMSEIKHRDNHVYRSLFAADTLAIPGIYTPYPDAKYADMAGDFYAPLMIGMWQELDALTRLLYLTSRSFDELQALAANKEQMSLSIPAIWPIDKKNMGGRSIGMFGGRNHPILGVYKMHSGVDLGGKTGEPIYATGNGTVVTETQRGAGYGKQILIDHGFGYKTRYAHLSKILVTLDQQVVRGELIGLMGSTGLSTSPHLHYEVVYMGHPVDPVNYFRDLDEETFEEIIRNAKETSFEK